MRTIPVFAVLILVLLSCTRQPKINAYKLDSHQLTLRLDPANKHILITDSLTISSEEPVSEVALLLNKNASVKSVTIAGQNVQYSFLKTFDQNRFLNSPDSAILSQYEMAGEITIKWKEAVEQQAITLQYQLVADDSVDQASFSREKIAYQVRGYCGAKGVFLSPSYFWYPDLPNRLSEFDLNVSLPDSFEVMSQGRIVRDTVSGGVRSVEWRADYPAENVHVVAANYDIKFTPYRDEVQIYTYFFPESQKLAPSYLAASLRYLAMYEEMIGFYPFSKFAVVENFFPTGFGMPSYTLLGSQVIRLPFIIHTSLGHEVAHNWWGNSVYVDYSSGNWCEGLTTYTADYHYAELKSPYDAMLYRRDIDRDYTVYVSDGRDFPLSHFRERTETASRAIGYGKSAMVFHQLRTLVGDSLFFKGLREFYDANLFREASWQDIQSSFELASGLDLRWFFTQWIQRPGAPSLTLKNVQYDNSVIKFTLEQPEPSFRLYVPIRIVTENDTTGKFVKFDTTRQDFQIPLAKRPVQLAVDPEFNLFRKLDRNEIPPTLSEVFATGKSIIVLPDRVDEQQLNRYRTLANMLEGAGDGEISIHEAGSVSEDALREHSLYILGSPEENSLWEKVDPVYPPGITVKEGRILVYNDEISATENVVVLSLREGAYPAQTAAMISMGKSAEIGRIGLLLVHYGKYSFLLFQEGHNRLKGVFKPGTSPLAYKF